MWPIARCPGSPSSVGAGKRVGDLPHRPRDAHPLAVGGRDAGAFLAAVLQGVKAEVRQIGSFGVPEDAEDPALVLELIVA